MLSNLRFSIESARVSKRMKVWRHLFKAPTLSVPKIDSLSERDHVFTLGSCFANEIRATLEQGGITVHPVIDPALANLFVDEVKIPPRWSEWDERVHYQCFTPFSIHQEIATALGGWRASNESIIECRFKGKKVFSDPYRRGIYARTRSDALEIRRRMDQKVREGIHNAKVLIFTLGLVEAFRLRKFGGYVSEFNAAFGSDQLEFVNGNYEQAHASLQASLNLIRSKYPTKQIVITVSPIPVARTFSNMDAISATMRAKSILRSCADSMMETYDNVTYWPSYEFAMWSGNAFCPQDGRHIRPEAVKQITSAFCRAFFQDSIANRIDMCTEVESSNPNPVSLRSRGKMWRFPFRKSA